MDKITEKKLEQIKRVQKSLKKLAKRKKRQTKVYHLWAFAPNGWRMLGKYLGYAKIKELKSEQVYKWLKDNGYNIMITKTTEVKDESS